MIRRLFRLGLGVVAAALLLGTWALYADYRQFLDTPLTVADEGALLVVPPGASVGRLGELLLYQGVLPAEGLIPRDRWLELYARLHDLAPRIKAGEYRIAPGTTPIALLEQLVAGRVVQHALTVVEGWTFRQLLAAVRAHDRLEHTLDGLTDAGIMARLGHPGQHPEGRFFPDTYHFPAATTDLAFLQRAYATMEAQLAAAWDRRAAGLPLQTPYEALILASIVEKETGLASERPDIAGVFVRRLEKGMRLQSDPTVIYGLGESYDGDIRRRDLTADTPYNTYTRAGLPPTPIALPGAESLAAAVNPAPGEALYFVARGDGSHVFSVTLEEHNRAVQDYLRQRQ
ncbi:MAG: endolytic transglycosylase MltG [Pseudomonadota bacterium]|nr:endolytic transglycosylase MltG [Pseudomonadota bacterium]